MNRRRFLTASTFAGAGSLLAPFARAQGANADLRVAVIGLHGRGRSHLDAMVRAKGARLVALCDCDPTVLAAAKDRAEKAGARVETYGDYRKLCEADDIDAVCIATPNHTHALIAITAAANGKHAYVEKPVSHNVWEGRVLADAQAKHGVIIHHGFQRRSETSWEEAFAWLEEGHFGALTLARGFCYKARPSIGKADGPQTPPAGLDYDLWCGPRPVVAPVRKKFHYDWHWQSAYGNGDLGNQGPHQLDVCRRALGDPKHFPPVVVSCGGRFGHDDDGDVANTQVVFFGYEPVPILFEVRGLPAKDLDFGSGVDSYQGQQTGNVIEYEGGRLTGGHDGSCAVFDAAGRQVKAFKGVRSHFQTWIDAIRSGKQEAAHSAESGHLSSSLAHLGNISWELGRPASSVEVKAAFTSAAAADAIDRMAAHLVANGLNPERTRIRLGSPLSIGGERFVGEDADRANARLKGSYRAGFELPV